MLCIRSRCSTLRHFACIRNISDKELFESLRPPGDPKPSATKPPSLTARVAACAELVKKHDYEHFLCLCLAPKNARPNLVALRAFNVEISKSAITPYSTPEEKELNKLKLIWWRNLLGEIYKDNLPEGSPPVAMELRRVVKSGRVTKGFLIKLVESRLKARNYTSLIDVEEHAESTFSALNILSAEICGYKTIDTDHAASHLGRAEGHIALIRSIPLLAQKGACIVPATTLSKAGVSQTDIIRGEKRDKVKEAIHDIASSAHIHLQHSENILQTLSPVTRQILLNAIPARRFLDRLQKHDFDIFNEKTLMTSPFLTFALTKEKLELNFKNNFKELVQVGVQVGKEVKKSIGSRK